MIIVRPTIYIYLYEGVNYLEQYKFIALYEPSIRASWPTSMLSSFCGFYYDNVGYILKGA